MKEKCRGIVLLCDIYGRNISTEELYLPGIYLKMVRSENISSKQFQIISLDVIIPLDEVFETFLEVADDFTMSTKSYLALCEPSK